MPANRKGKCDCCNKQRTDLELCGDDLMCRPCEVKNAVELTKIKLSDNGASAAATSNDTPTVSGESSTAQSDSPASTELLYCKQEILILRQTVTKLQNQVSFLLSFVGAVDCSPSATGGGGDSTDSCGEAETVAGEKSSFVGTVKTPIVSDLQCNTSNNQPTIAKQIHCKRSPDASLCHALTAAVYVDMRDSELRARNVVISGLSEGRSQTDKDIAANLFAHELNFQPNIQHCKRLGRHIAGKTRPMMVTFDSAEGVTACMEKAKVLRRSTNDSVREHVYINRDLTKAQAQAAYEMRCRRREAIAKRRDRDLNAVLDGAGNSATSATTAPDLNPSDGGGNSTTSATTAPDLNPSASVFQPSSDLSEN